MAANEMKGKYREISTAELLDMLPEPAAAMPKVTQDFSPILNAEKEVALYEPFVCCFSPFHLGSTNVNPDLAHEALFEERLDTHKHPDPDSRIVWGDHKIEPDMALYETAREPGAPLCQASQMASVGEFKLDPVDEPFRIDAEPVKREKATKTKGGKQTKPFERKAETARATRGQLTVYINAIQASQHRTRTFAFYVRRKWCRLLCHSRAGTEVTPLIDYTESLDLQTFFWRFTHASAEHRGVDITFEPVPSIDISSDVQDARLALGTTSSKPLFKVLVPEIPEQASSTLSETSSTPPPNKLFYVSEPFTTNHLFPVGRGPRCFYAYDPISRAVRLNYTKKKRPIFSALLLLVTLTVYFIDAVERQFSLSKTLSNCFGQARKALEPVPFNARIAHRHACTKAGILHQDISFGNIIIVGDRGYLIDWEFGRWDGEGDSSADERRGTWQFLSIRLLKNPTIYHEIRDDIEPLPNAQSSSACLDYKPLEPATTKHRFVLAGEASVTEEGVGPMLQNLYFEDLLVSIIESLVPLYRKRAGKASAEQVERILTHDWMADTMKNALENVEWKRMIDAAVDHEVVHAVRNLRRRRRSSALYMQQAKRQKRLSGDEGDKDDEDEADDSDFIEY
ncbi:hypothetical protein BT96DRAFT_1025057 [Gymnopus androsaceus JB14]|uniref:Fungal-type protein kinase domain-containing protein n=1 Tax=Gymnopus androsaceus JB14 TaxID=1447944 RepID=A0A6A4GVH6_9AGAR|nr:hypothetical protein BT96DRAFT_1025057 [Gymnopus androsaceus JB14]